MSSVDVIHRLGQIPTDRQSVPSLESFLLSSQLVYGYAAIRDVTNNHDEEINNQLTVEQKKAKERNGFKFAAFDRTTLILTDRAQGDKHSESSSLHYPITAAAILTFIQLNRHLINDKLGFRKEGINKQPGDFPELKIEAQLQTLGKFDAEIWEFDDRFEKSELVYSIIVNKTGKRITTVFRGSVWGNDDWPTNFNLWKCNPEILKEFAEKLGVHKLGVHRGFANYLFNPNRGDNKSKFEEIATNIDEIRAYRHPIENNTPYKDFEICVTGHSLGGALAQLLSCALAGSDRTAGYPSPIFAATYASPQVGDSGWLDAYTKLEKKGRLLHIRISTEEDHVAVHPAIPFMGYTQTGVGVNLRSKEEAIVKYRNAKSAWSAFSATKPWDMHSLDVYNERLLYTQNEKYLEKTFQEFYNEHANFSN